MRSPNSLVLPSPTSPSLVAPAVPALRGLANARHHKSHRSHDDSEGTTEPGVADNGFTWPNPSSIGNFEVPNAFVNGVITEDDQQAHIGVLRSKWDSPEPGRCGAAVGRAARPACLASPHPVNKLHQTKRACPAPCICSPSCSYCS
ncbi:hypothetical protein RR46_02520 [Papilio xuthus]|uniref:Uncharacterized protein n=1 Tax=Papilio xuthus TaxID=66420 RepID=A0A194QH04_PAPXU|nr:hypothetical protein RR46_02520 [Papilio xuthus]